jgi:multidrug efflux pump subunit AcrA (membrane-fusion protein)
MSETKAGDALGRPVIESGATPAGRRRPMWKRRRAWQLLAAVDAAAFVSRRGRPVQAEIAAVANAYPAQAMAVLNATGRVVAARRVSVSSKATGRLDWLGVLEGQRVAEGELIARLENRDVDASRRQVAAAVKAAVTRRHG